MEPGGTDAARRGMIERLEHEVREKVAACMQCGTCTGSCPNSFAMDVTPRHMWRLVLADAWDELWRTQTFRLCSACYTCTLRCPRGLPLTDTVAALKRLAVFTAPGLDPGGEVFAKCFMDHVRRHGRLHESAFMTTYLLRMSPAAAFRFAPLGLRFMVRGKMGPPVAAGRAAGPVETLFAEASRREGW